MFLYIYIYIYIYIYFTCYCYADAIKKSSLKDTKLFYNRRLENFYETLKEF